MSIDTNTSADDTQHPWGLIAEYVSADEDTSTSSAAGPKAESGPREMAVIRLSGAAPTARSSAADRIAEGNARVQRETEDARMAAFTTGSRRKGARTGTEAPAPTITPTIADGAPVPPILAGEVGQRVADLLDLDSIGSAAKKVLHRIDDEAKELAEEQRSGLERHITETLTAAWTEARAKHKVPPIVGPVVHHDEHARLTTNIDWRARDLSARVNAQHAQRNRERVAERISAVDAIVTEEARAVLADAGAAADELAAVDLTPDASPAEVIDSGDERSIAAVRDWRSAVTRWSDLQSVRAWVAVAVDRGFSQRTPTELEPAPRRLTGPFAPTVDHRDPAEFVAWTGQLRGVNMPLGVAAAGALATWLRKGRPEANGVAVASE